MRIDSILPSEKAGCLSHVQWQPLDTGKCAAEYNIKFTDRFSRIVGIVKTVKNNITSFCTADYANIHSLIIWATYSGVKGTESQVIVLTTTRETIIAGMLIGFLQKKSKLLKNCLLI